MLAGGVKMCILQRYSSKKCIGHILSSSHERKTVKDDDEYERLVKVIKKGQEKNS